MDDKKPDPDRIAEEAVGEALESRRPDAGKEEPRPAPTSTGPEANVAARTAESVGERVGDATRTPRRTRHKSGRGTLFGKVRGRPGPHKAVRAAIGCLPAVSRS
jgi:hypothetical protein